MRIFEIYRIFVPTRQLHSTNRKDQIWHTPPFVLEVDVSTEQIHILDSAVIGKHKQIHISNQSTLRAISPTHEIQATLQHYTIRSEKPPVTSPKRILFHKLFKKPQNFWKITIIRAIFLTADQNKFRNKIPFLTLPKFLILIKQEVHSLIFETTPITQISVPLQKIQVI